MLALQRANSACGEEGDLALSAVLYGAALQRVLSVSKLRPGLLEGRALREDEQIDRGVVEVMSCLVYRSEDKSLLFKLREA